MNDLWTPSRQMATPYGDLDMPWAPPFGAGIPQSPSGGGGGGGAWTFLGNTPAAAAGVLDVTGMTGHTHYCAMLRGLLANTVFAGTLDMQISDNNGASFYSTFDHEGRKTHRYSGALTVLETAYTLDSSFSLIDGSLNEISDPSAENGIWGKIWFWEPGLAATREAHMEFALVYIGENGLLARTIGFGQYPSFTNGIGAINAFRLFTGFNFAASGSIDLYGIT